MTNLVWLDLEMTGLDPELERIIEIATIVTDTNLHIIAEGPNIVVHQSNALLNSMDEWNTDHHTRSGLVKAVQESAISEALAEKQTLDFLSQYVQPGDSPLCGNTISQDRRFLVKYMPKLANFFHYRNIDVTSVKLLAHYWQPEVLADSSKRASHRALDDVRDSIAELRHYRERFFRLS